MNTLYSFSSLAHLAFKKSIVTFNIILLFIASFAPISFFQMSLVLGSSALLASNSAYAQTTGTGTVTTPKTAQDALTGAVTQVKGWLIALGTLIISVAVVFVGYRMLFAAAQWKDVAPVFWGATLVGAGAMLASVLFTASGAGNG